MNDFNIFNSSEKNKKVIYLACPYSAPTKQLEVRRFDIANRVAGYLMSKGYIVFSPLSHSHPIATYPYADLPRTHAFWLEQDFHWLDACEILVIINTTGWEFSYGVQQEVSFARAKEMPIYLIDPIYYSVGEFKYYA